MGRGKQVINVQGGRKHVPVGQIMCRQFNDLTHDEERGRNYRSRMGALVLIIWKKVEHRTLGSSGIALSSYDLYSMLTPRTLRLCFELLNNLSPTRNKKQTVTMHLLRTGGLRQVSPCTAHFHFAVHTLL